MPKSMPHYKQFLLEYFDGPAGMEARLGDYCLMHGIEGLLKAFDDWIKLQKWYKETFEK